MEWRSGERTSSFTSSLSDKSTQSNWFCVTARFSTLLSLWPGVRGVSLARVDVAASRNDRAG